MKRLTLEKEMLRLARLVAGGIVVAALAPSAHAQWTVIYLSPAGGEAYDVGGGQQVGAYGGASLWSGTAASRVSLHPAGQVQSEAWGVGGGQQVGWTNAGTGSSTKRAALWSGTAASWVDLSGGAESIALGVDGGHQVGTRGGNGAERAGMWSGTAASWVDLNPAGAHSSEAWGVHGGQQVGRTYFVVGNVFGASLWSGTPASWVSLHPAGASESGAGGVHGGQQVGYAIPVGGFIHASLWSGTAASWVDLNPAGTEASWAGGVHAGQQVGWAFVDNSRRASLWSGTAASWVNLHAFLPPNFYRSEAYGIWHDAGVTYVVGIGYTSGLITQALMWVSGSPCYPDCNADGSLSVADFGCFQTKFVAGDPYADCNGVGGLTIADFGCFQTKFVAGCP